MLYYRHLCTTLLFASAIAASLTRSLGQRVPVAATSAPAGPSYNYGSAGATRNGHLLVLDKLGRPIPVLPGLLDETLLLRGSFSFGAKTVKFDKLKVLGNVYVRRINGRLLRDSYLLKSSINKKRSQELTDDQSQIKRRSKVGGKLEEGDELTLHILK